MRGSARLTTEPQLKQPAYPPQQTTECEECGVKGRSSVARNPATLAAGSMPTHARVAASRAACSRAFQPAASLAMSTMSRRRTAGKIIALSSLSAMLRGRLVPHNGVEPAAACEHGLYQ